MTELEEVPDRIAAVESQIVQLRTETRVEFSAVRNEFAAVRQEMRHEFAAVRVEMRAGDEETRRYMRVLHEEVIGRLAVIQEGQGAKRARRGKKND